MQQMVVPVSLQGGVQPGGMRVTQTCGHYFGLPKCDRKLVRLIQRIYYERSQDFALRVGTY